MKYTLTKKNIKNFIIRIYPDTSIKISVPLYATKEEIENFIISKKNWIEKNINKIKSTVTSKNSLLILGKLKEIRLIKSEINMIRMSEKSIYLYYVEANLSEEDIINRLDVWKTKFLNEIILKYLDKYLKLLKTSINEYKIKKMKSAWGIYHFRNNYITFNSLLIEKDEKFIEYVVLHELCHIFYQNHQKEFCSLVEKFMPNYKKYRRA